LEAARDGGVSGRVVSLNASLDQSTSDIILANIVRASQYQALTFVAVSKVGGTQSVSLNNGLPTFTFGPGLTTPQHQFVFGSNSLNNQAAGNLDVVPLATKEFAKGVSVDISLPEVFVLVKQGLPRDLVYNVVVDSVEYTDSTGRHWFKNDPLDETYKDFKATMLSLVAFGYSVETRTQENSYYNKEDKNSASVMTDGRFCFDPTLSDRTLLRKMSERVKLTMDQWWICNTAWSKRSPPPKKATNNNAGEKKNAPKPKPAPTPSDDGADRPITVYFPDGLKEVSNVVFRMRSLVGVFNFLGMSIANTQQAFVRAATDKQAKDLANEIYDGGRVTSLEQLGLPILNVTKVPSQPCFASVVVNGEYYCVPREGSDNTKRAFSIVAQLLALKTTAVDLPSTPSVRVTP